LIMKQTNFYQLERSAKRDIMLAKLGLRFHCSRIKNWTDQQECFARYQNQKLPCSECAKALAWFGRLQKTEVKDMPKNTRTCNKCRKEKSIEQFRLSEFTGDRVATCDDCERKYKLGPYRNNADTTEHMLNDATSNATSINEQCSTDNAIDAAVDENFDMLGGIVQDNKGKQCRSNWQKHVHRIHFNACPELAERVKQRAKEQFRTFSAQVIWELLQAEKMQNKECATNY